MKITIKYSTYKRINRGCRSINGTYDAEHKTIAVDIQMPQADYIKALLAPASELVSMAKALDNTITEEQAEQSRESLKAWAAQYQWSCTVNEVNEIITAIKTAEQETLSRMEETGKAITSDTDRTIRVDADIPGMETIITVKAGDRWIDSIPFPIFATRVTDNNTYECLYR